MTELRKLYVYDSGTGNEIKIDDSTSCITTVLYEHHEIHSGSHYFVTSYQDPAINNVLQFSLQTANTTSWMHWTWTISTESETLWQVYEGGSIGTPLANAVTPRNSNRNSANTSGVTMKYQLHATTAAANTAIDVSGATLLQSGISGSGKDAGTAGRSNEIILKQNQLYVLRATANAAGFVNFDMQWYEHTDAA